MKGWLDNFNDSKVKIPTGFVGQGETIPNWKSPAWGGQFQNGGQTDYWNTNRTAWVDSTNHAPDNINKNFIQRMYQENTPSIPTPRIAGNTDEWHRGMRSTHLMSDNGNGYVFPHVVMDNGKLRYIPTDDEAEAFAKQHNEGIQFKTPEQGSWYSTNGYKQGTGVLKNFQYGGILDTKQFNPTGTKGSDEYKGQEANSYWTDEKTLPRNLRNRAKEGRRPSPEEEKEIDASKEYVGSHPETGADVYTVDGELVRKYVYPDFSEGGNDQAYPNFVPKGQVWLDKFNIGGDRKTTLAHELLEREKMMGGMFYDKYGKDGKEAGAHVHALEFENEIRNGKAEVPQLVNKQQQPENNLQPIQQSMQNGGMTYFQNGLDFKPKTISRDGSVVKDNLGYWNPANQGKVVEISSPNITMQGVDRELVGVSDTGDTKLLIPGNDYKFKGNKVREYPVAQKGGKYPSTKYGINEFQQLQDFTNKPSNDRNWLKKYEQI
jgi:hypothetical protein